MSNKDKKLLYVKSEMKEEEWIKDSIIASFWKLFRFLLTEMMPIGCQNDYLVGTLIISEKQNEFASCLLDKALRIDGNKLILS